MTSRSKKKQKTNYLHTARGTEAADLGRLVAEEDNELGEYYVAPEIYVDKAIDVNHPALFFRGPKGIGKSAVLRMAEIMLERRSETKRIIRISPDDLAFSGLANIQATTPILANATANQWLFKFDFRTLGGLFDRVNQGVQDFSAALAGEWERRNLFANRLLA